MISQRQSSEREEAERLMRRKMERQSNRKKRKHAVMPCEKVINLVMSPTVGFMIILVHGKEEKRKFKKGGGGVLWVDVWNWLRH